MERAKERVELIHGFDRTALNTPVVKDRHYNTLVKPVNHKEQTTAVLSMLIEEATHVMKRQLVD